MSDISINPSTKVITVRHESGGADHYHTDPAESEEFFRTAHAYAQGRTELGLLLYSDKVDRFREARAADGRTDDQLKADWLRKVIAAGADPEEARVFLGVRLKAE